jgi:putative hydrolase of the HAD superfamily
MYADDEAPQVKNKYKTIVFDLGNTLIRFDHNISARKIANLFNLDSRKIYDAFFDSEITRAFEKGLLSPKSFYGKASALLGIKLPYEDFVPIWNDIFWEDEDVCDLARELKKNYKLFLLSNVNRLHFEHIEKKFEIIKIFDELILSFVVGATKPERQIYEDVIRRAGGDKGSILYIDDREDLIKEATALGIDSIRFESAGKLRDLLSIKKVI